VFRGLAYLQQRHVYTESYRQGRRGGLRPEN
jgi:hypothetical protein